MRLTRFDLSTAVTINNTDEYIAKSPYGVGDYEFITNGIGDKEQISLLS